jgi:hypothetical protein
MSFSTAVGFVAFQAESSFANTSSDAYTTRVIPRDGSVDLSGLARPMVERPLVSQYLNSGSAPVPGAFGAGTFSFTLDLHGHGLTAAGSLTAHSLQTLLGHALGAANSAQVGGALTSGAHSTTSLVSTNTTLAAGGLLRVGALGDGRANGQATVSTTASSAYTLGVALPATPNTGDIVYPMLMAHPISSSASTQLTSSGASTNNTLRFVLASGNLQFVARGCACTGITISGTNPGEMPQIQFTFSAAAWGPVSQTFPSATSATDYAPAPATAGSVFLQAKGTSTRATVSAREFAVSIGIGMQPVFGPGGSTSGQNIVGWTRVPAQTTVSLSVPSEAATATPTYWDLFRTDPNSATARHLLWLSAPVDGRAVAFYFPKLRPIGNIPTQSEIDGLAYVPLQFRADTDEAGSDSLRRANFVVGMG